MLDYQSVLLITGTLALLGVILLISIRPYSREPRSEQVGLGKTGRAGSVNRPGRKSQKSPDAAPAKEVPPRKRQA